jgi:glutamate synthase (NADPH/NADH) small chain
VLGINSDPVTIKQVEIEIIDRAWEEGWVRPQPPEAKTGFSVAVIGSGPSGLAAAQQLTRAGHDVTVYERADRIGGLLRYGIPEFKMEKKRLDRRLEQMAAEGTYFLAGVEVGGRGPNDLSVEDLRSRFDAVVLAVGATAWRDLPIPGRENTGVHQAMEYLPPSNRVQQGDYARSDIDAAGKHVVVIGGGDTGADCVGTAHRQGAASVTQLEIMPIPPSERPATNPWPTYPAIFRVSSAHEEGGERLFSVNTEEFLGGPDGELRALKLVDVERVDGRFTPVEGSARELPADLVFLAMGFLGPQKEGLVETLEVECDERGNIRRDASFETSVPGVFVAGDAGRGQSLIVWAIAEGRSAAAGVDEKLTGRGVLPRPINPGDRAFA